jgi:hypothetical protein
LQVVSVVYRQAGSCLGARIAPMALTFAQVYYASNLDAFPGSRKEKKAVALKRMTSIVAAVID